VTDDVETVRPLEILHRAAVMLGAVIVLTTNRDRRRNGKRVDSADAGAKLQDLLVVRPVPNKDMTRWERLARGTTLAQADVIDAVQLDEVAELLIHQLAMSQKWAA
jgi:hypothetical protein